MDSASPIAVVGDGPLADGVRAELAEAGRVAKHYPADVHVDALADAAAVVIVAFDDAKNVDLALSLHQKFPEIRIVVRVFDPVLEGYLAETAPGIVVNSMSAIAAPVIAGALKDVVEGGHNERWDSPWRLLTVRFERLFLFVIALITVLAIVGTLFFSQAMHLPIVDALYFVITTLTTTGYGDISVKEAPTAVKLATVVFMIAGASSLSLFFAVMADWVFARRLDLVMGRLPSRWSKHVIIAGAGNMTLRVAQELRARDIRAIVIERDPETRAIARLRKDDHHVLIADATKDESLRLAGVERAAAIIVLTDHDAYNLHISLLGRSFNSKAKILARIDSPLLSRHIAAHAGLDAVSPVELAAREFARSALAKVSKPPPKVVTPPD